MPPTKVIPVCRLVGRHKKEIAKHSYNQIDTNQNTSGDEIGPMAFKGETNNLVQLQYLNLQTKAAVLFLFDKKNIPILETLDTDLFEQYQKQAVHGKPKSH